MKCTVHLTPEPRATQPLVDEMKMVGSFLPLNDCHRRSSGTLARSRGPTMNSDEDKRTASSRRKRKYFFLWKIVDATLGSEFLLQNRTQYYYIIYR